jgi:hypothetical protein
MNRTLSLKDDRQLVGHVRRDRLLPDPAWSDNGDQSTATEVLHQRVDDIGAGDHSHERAWQIVRGPGCGGVRQGRSGAVRDRHRCNEALARPGTLSRYRLPA